MDLRPAAGVRQAGEGGAGAGEASRWSSPLGRWLRGLVFDSSSSLPSLSAVTDTIRRELEHTAALGVLFVRLEHWGEIQQLFTWRQLEEVYQSLSSVACEMVGKGIRAVDLPADLGLHGEGFAVILSAPREATRLETETVDLVAQRISAAVRVHLDDALAPQLNERITVDVGAGLILRPEEEGETLEECLVRGLVAAEQAAVDKQHLRLQRMGEQLEEVLAEGRLEVLYQPIADLASGRVAGFQTEVRGPESFGLQHGDVLLDVARRTGLTYRALDAYHVAALSIPRDAVAPQEFLLLRVSASELLESAVRVTSVLYGLQGYELSPANVVFLLQGAEVLAEFHSSLVAFRATAEMGFRLALDLRPDCLPALDYLRELEPDFLRISGRSVHALSLHPDEFELLLLLARFAGRHAMQVLAADCTERAQVQALGRAGVALASGSLLAPAASRPARSELRIP